MAMTASRKSMHSVMAHSGFGECTISRPDGIIAIIQSNHQGNWGAQEESGSPPQ